MGSRGDVEYRRDSVNSNVCVKSDFHGSSFPISPLISRLVCLYNTGSNNLASNLVEANAVA